MAVFKFYPVAPTGTGTSANVIYAGTLAAAGTQTITVGKNNLFRIVASQPITIRFGVAGTITAAGAGDIYIPGNMPEIFDMGNQNETINVYSFNASTIVTVNQVVKN